MTTHPSAQLLARHLGAQLDAAEAQGVERHLAGCERCRGELETLQQLGLRATEAEEALAATHTSAPRPVERVERGDGTPNPERVGRYVILKALGQGAMGQVYLAYDPRLDRQVAVKLLRPDVAAVENRALRLRLEREAQALARLSHPNVVAVHDLGDHHDSLFIAMDYVAGETLGDWLRVPRAWREVQRVFLMAGEGLAAAHRAGLVHRDVKPDNVLVGADGVARVSDFGVSRRVREDDGQASEDTITGAGSLIGTPAYMAPEQFDGRPADERSDQYAFCVALFEALVGRRPYSATSLRELRDAVHLGGARFPERSEVPRWLQALVLRGLAPDPALRFESMDVLLVALRGPRRLSRSFVGALVAVVVVGAVATVLGAREVARRRADPCVQLDARLAEAWGPAARERVTRQLVATGLPYAADTARRVATLFDDFLTRWRGHYAASCQLLESAAGSERSQLLVRQACLEARFSDFVHLRDGLARASPDMVRGAVRNVSASLSSQGCSLASAGLDAPEAPEQRAAFERLRERYLELAGEVRIGAPTDQRERLATLRREAEGSGLKALAAAVRLLEASEVLRREGPLAALGVFEDVALRAEVARDDWLVFVARLELVKLLGDSIDGRRARALVPALRAAAERAGRAPDEDPEVVHAEAVVQHAEGRLHEAVALQRKAVDLLARDDEAAPRLYLALDSLAAFESRAGLAEEALASSERALALARAQLGEQHPDYALLLNTRATLLYRAQRLDEARAVTARVLELLAADPDQRDYTMFLYNAGVLDNRYGRREEAVAKQRRAVALARELGEVGRLATMRAGYAETLQELGRLDEAVVESAAAVEAAEQAHGRDSIHVAHSLAVHGAILEALKRFPEAAATLERALALQQGESANPVLRDITRYDLARVRWQDRGRRREAVEEVKAVRAAFVARGDAYAEYVRECDDWLRAHPPR